MIEAGIAVIAICLPTLKPLVVPGTVNSLVASVRSMVSLESLRVRASGNTRGAGASTKDARDIEGTVIVANKGGD
jgi:hypothetical protein